MVISGVRAPSRPAICDIIDLDGGVGLRHFVRADGIIPLIDRLEVLSLVIPRHGSQVELISPSVVRPVFTADAH